MLKIFVVVLNWNRADDTNACLDSIEKLVIPRSKIHLEIVVVDNASVTDSLIKIKKHLKKDLRSTLIVNKENLGFAGGNNVGITYSLNRGADYIMVLNNDTRLAPTSLAKLVDVAEKYSDFGAASPKIYFEKGYEFHKKRYKREDLGKVIWYSGGEIDWGNVYGKTRGVDEVDGGQYDTMEKTDYATGTCMFIRAKVLKDVGLFDEKYFMYYEDTDLSMRLIKSGYGVFYVPSSVIWHKVAQSSGIGGDLNDYFITRNRLLFGIKYAPLRSKIALIKESLRFTISGRKWQRTGVHDFYLRKLERGSWPLARKENEKS